MLSPKAKAFSVEQLLRRPLKEEKARKHVSSDSFQIPRGDGRVEEIRVQLCHNDLWQAFHRLGTEMIITKTGRRMFPPLRLRVTGTELTARYVISLEFVNVDRHKYRYIYSSSKWIVSGSGEALTNGHRYRHSDGPFDSHSLLNQIISFDKVKLTNNPSPKPGQMSLSSMQRFQPQIHVEKLGEDNSVICHTVVSFPQTRFMAVTAYQNQEITRLKIAKNPFAKGFREAGKSRQSSLDNVVTTLQAYLSHKEAMVRKRKTTDITEEDNDFIVPAKALKILTKMPESSQLPLSPESSTYIRDSSPVRTILSHPQRSHNQIPLTILDYQNNVTSSTHATDNATSSIRATYNNVASSICGTYSNVTSDNNITSSSTCVCIKVENRHVVTKVAMPLCCCWSLGDGKCGGLPDGFSGSDRVAWPWSYVPCFCACCSQALPIDTLDRQNPFQTFDEDIKR